MNQHTPPLRGLQNMKSTFLRSIALSFAALPLLAGAASAQLYPNGWGWGGWGNPYGGPGGVVAAQADMVKAVGQLNIDQEKARVEREQANQAKLQTQRKAFDQMLYERSLKPTYVEDLKYEQNRIVARMMINAQPAEINRGTTLNTFMPYIMKMAQTGVQGPPVPINPAALRRVNVTTGSGGPQLGELRHLPLTWPMALRGPLQQKIDPLLNSAVSAATTGSLQPDLLNEVRTLAKKIEDDFLNRFRAEQVSTSDYLVATRFLDSLKPAIQALSSPDIGRLLDGSVAAQGSNVPELVSNMTFDGLSFAPGNPGSEAAYLAVHNAFVAYIRTAQASTGMQPRMRPPDPLAQR